jgi:hypothetical protein
LPGDPLQVEPDAQSVSAVHIVLQALFATSQANGAQLTGDGLHTPAAQTEVVKLIPSGQLAGAQVPPAG